MLEFEGNDVILCWNREPAALYDIDLHTLEDYLYSSSRVLERSFHVGYKHVIANVSMTRGKV